MAFDPPDSGFDTTRAMVCRFRSLIYFLPIALISALNPPISALNSPFIESIIHSICRRLSQAETKTDKTKIATPTKIVVFAPIAQILFEIDPAILP